MSRTQGAMAGAGALPYPAAMIWLRNADDIAESLPAIWLVATPERPATLPERSALRRGVAAGILARQLGLPLAAIAIGHEAGGRPLVAQPSGNGLHLSLATRAGMVAVALARRPVGVDVEAVDETAAPPMGVLHPEESAWLLAQPRASRALAFARLWSAKEAYVKALGTGFARAPESFAVSLSAEGRVTVRDGADALVASGFSRIIENGGQEIPAAAIVVIG
ncbi:MAG: 4'-phosphopantetheinyl transferase superfamily protein [Bosea sp. (in: a-proteobacteria)]|uniref:4'-phosphopantetheinyl transferase family protein n=1 Tax=Bosea sp. (in: a-proteobacteria) TaxID=1871050 RepID=UPI0027339FE7|nr:4'-phosphopantetheinyl transferase superfamily protein [Bosea sp. (in: a-proteobacteria)]MDP3258122.1 4'-phosphopantetheinyl transferase superfamily protein [Bosea sp. (in: a-proteobacteria)]MDP3318937.1 4'-phosphopantetheinyl transferase superfamily protein [Bosea sp. (in: a-proteobacteria)]